MNKTVSERWWDLYLNDDGCKKNFNGLHLICAMYGDGEDSDTVMQSMARDYHNQLFPLEFVKTDSQFKESLSSCMWNDQYPEGYFAHLQAQLPKLRRLDIRPYTDVPTFKNWEEWGWDLISIDNAIKGNRKNIWITGKRLEGLLTEEQKTELQKRLKYYHGVVQNGRKVVNDWYDPWLSADANAHRT